MKKLSQLKQEITGEEELHAFITASSPLSFVYTKIMSLHIRDWML